MAHPHALSDKNGVVDPAAVILVVDDEPNIRQLLELVLAEEGFRVVTAQNGIDALRVVATESPAIVVTDLMMPHLDGYGLIERLRAAHLPIRGIIAMSAAEVPRARPAGADLFIAKPFNVEHVIACVYALLSADGSVANKSLGSAHHG